MRVEQAEIKNGTVVPIVQAFEVDLRTVPSSDPLAFVMGISRGKFYAANRDKLHNGLMKIDHGCNHRDLAKEYLRGFLLGYRGILVKEGTRILKGCEQTLFHLKDNILKP